MVMSCGRGGDWKGHCSNPCGCQHRHTQLLLPGGVVRLPEGCSTAGSAMVVLHVGAVEITLPFYLPFCFFLN